MIPVLGSREMRAADAETIRRGTPSLELMENAASALADETLSAVPGASRVVVVCGPGNNGGDGLGAALRLLDAGVAVAVYCLGDPETYRGDPAILLERARDRGVEALPLSPGSHVRRFLTALESADAAIDALFGTGLSRPLTGLAKRVVEGLNASGCPVVAADVPSGLSADSGKPPGPCVRAARTVALAAPKPCHVLPPARAFCGRVVVADIGIPRAFLDRRGGRLRLTEPSDVRDVFPPRPADSHKGDFGRVAIVAGSAGKAGAAVLAARGALRAGAGLVTVFSIGEVTAAVVASLPEAMTVALDGRDGALAAESARGLARRLEGFDAAVVGPGLGSSPEVRAFVSGLLRLPLPVVCDADALNAFAGEPGQFSRRGRRTILTPHPGEAGRLLGMETKAIQADRLAATRALVRASRSVVVLKGEGTLVGAPSGRVTVNPTGSPLLSTAGSGDVLAGAIGALLASGLGAEEAAWAGVYLHGAAGDLLERRLGDAGLLASELADALPRVRRRLRTRRPA